MMAGKPKSFKTAWKKMLAYMRQYIPALIVASILVIIGTVFTVIGPDRLSDLADLIAEGMFTGTIDLDGVAAIGTFLVIIYLLSAVLTYGQGFIVATIVQRLSKRLRTDISKKINRLPLRYFDRTSYGDVLSRVTNDVDTISMSMNQSVGMLMSSAALLIGSLVMMLYTDLIMTAAAVGSAVAGFMLMALIMVKSQKYFERQQKHLGRLNGHVEEMYSGHVIVRAYNGEKAAQKEFDSINDELFDSA
ncbi:MAG: ABC transporter ATP-binding protein, partial [Methanomassiliicoccales archaeon]|nr:ABC transporter ATP-binding protein [Methanomassiliicoccales archaeon]